MELIQLLFTLLPFIVVLGMALVVVVFAGSALGRPFMLLAVYMAVFFTFPQSSYGVASVFASLPIYSRGSGQLLFPIVLWLLLLSVVWTWIGRRFANEVPAGVPTVQWWLLGWTLLLATHVVAAPFLGASPKAALGSNGFIHIPWMAPLVLLMVWSAASARAPRLETVARLLVVAGLLKAIYGLTRWAAFGGDPSNIYANVEGLNVKLTYFDIVDSLVCLIALAAAGSLLLVRRSEQASKFWDALCAITVAACLATIVLSYRRTSWGGLLLVAAFFFVLLPARRRFLFALAVIPPLLGALLFVADQRLANSPFTGFEKLFADLLQTASGADTTRLLELRLAWEAFLDSPIAGIGSWGQFASGRLIPWQKGDDAGAFVHSGVLHLAMKSGLVGLILLGGLIAAIVMQARAALKCEGAGAQALAVAGVAGLLFMIPDFIFGTPVPQTRTTQLLAFCIGLPCMVVATERAALLRGRLAPLLVRRQAGVRAPRPSPAH